MVAAQPTAEIPVVRAATPRRRPPESPVAAGLRAALRLATVLVGLATAVVVLGPSRMVGDGMSFTDRLLAQHPTIAAWVAAQGGVEPAGNLLLFVPFATLLALSVRFRWLPVAFLLLLVSPVAVEWVQQYLPGRVSDAMDVVRNAIGLIVAFGVVAVARIALRLLWAPLR